MPLPLRPNPEAPFYKRTVCFTFHEVTARLRVAEGGAAPCLPHGKDRARAFCENCCLCTRFK